MCCPRGSVLIKAETVSLQVHKQPACAHTHCTEQGKREVAAERHWHGVEGGGLGRAAEIRKHHSVLNRGYVEVIEPEHYSSLTSVQKSK